MYMAATEARVRAKQRAPDVLLSVAAALCQFRVCVHQHYTDLGLGALMLRLLSLAFFAGQRGATAASYTLLKPTRRRYDSFCASLRLGVGLAW